MLLSDIDNVRQLVELLGDDGFVDALKSAERVVDEANDTLERVEEVEEEAEQAVREANETMQAVDRRLARVDETIRKLEAKIEAGFSLAFLFFGVKRFFDGELLVAAGLIGLGLLGAGALFVTIVTLPQVQKLRQFARFALERFVEERRQSKDDPARTAGSAKRRGDGGRR